MYINIIDIIRDERSKKRKGRNQKDIKTYQHDYYLTHTKPKRKSKSKDKQN